MNDNSIIDLFWLILKILAALALVGVLGLVLYLVWEAAKRMLKTSWDIVRGRNASVTGTVSFSIAVVVLVSAVVMLVGYSYPNH
jgi:ABC-type sulfate transport system permease component